MPTFDQARPSHLDSAPAADAALALDAMLLVEGGSAYLVRMLDERTWPIVRDAPVRAGRHAALGHDSDGGDGMPRTLQVRTRQQAPRAAHAAAVVLLRAAAVLVRAAWVRYRRHREASRICHELQALDDRTLLDLGFHRDEIASVAAEISQRAECTRLRARQALERPR